MNATTRTAQPLRPLNVVVVTIDTLRPDHLHCYGYQPIRTPVLDGIAQSGVLFENAVTQTPLTLPSHASIFTGLYPTKHHVRNTGGFILPSSSKTLATILQQQGWDTAAFVSSDVLKKLFGFNQGFAVYDDQMPGPTSAQKLLETPQRNAGDTIDRALGWLNKQSGKPLFLWVHLYDPHMPYHLPSSFHETYKERPPYDREIAYVDQELRRLFEAVQRKSAQTLIAVLSDHGESLGEHGEYSHGIFLYDATLRIVFLMSGPGIPAGLRVKDQSRTIDFLPTILELMGGKAPAEVQGASLLPSLARKEVSTAISYGETLYPKINMGWTELRAIRTNRWKYIRAPKRELYDLSQDPAERHNIIESHAAEAQKFEAQLNAVSGYGPEKVETASADQRTMDQLKSLGYLSAASRAFELNGQGIDPKDRVGILRLLANATNPDPRTTDTRRIEFLQQALREDPTNPDVYFQLGARYEKANRDGDAVKLYRTALQRGIENSRLHARIADHLVHLGKKDEAIAEYENAARIDPDPESQMNLATLYLEKKRIPDAERIFNWIVITDPARGPAYNGLGLIAIQRQDPATARRYFEKAAEVDPDLASAQLNLGLLYKMAGDRAHALACFETFLVKASSAQYGAIIPKIRRELASVR